MDFEFPVTFGCVDLDGGSNQRDFCTTIASAADTAASKFTAVAFPSGERPNQPLHFDVLIVKTQLRSERLFSLASKLRSMTEHIVRPTWIVGHTDQRDSFVERMKGLGLESIAAEEQLNQRISSFVHTRTTDPHNPEIEALELQRLFDSRQHSRILKHTARHADVPSTQATRQTFEGMVWFMEDNLPKAEKALRAALAQRNHSLPIRHLLARVLVRQGKNSDAQMLLEQHPMFPFQETICLLGLAGIALENSDHRKAEQYFQTCHQRDNHNSEADLGLGKIAFARGDLVKASEHFVRAGHQDELASYFNQMGIALVNQRRFQDALFIYQSALKVLPAGDKHHFIHYNIGLAQKKRGALLEAAQSFATSLKLAPGYEKALQGLADVLRLAASAGEEQSNFEPHRKLLEELKNKT